MKMLRPSEIYELEKRIWTQDDFEQMGWHDVTVHAVTFKPEEFEFILDIDYMFAWVDPEPPSRGFTFWMSPATLVFKNVSNFKAELGDPLGLEIAGITRINPRAPKNVDYIRLKTEWTWIIELLNGEIAFSSVGFDQHIRQAPIRKSNQCFSLQERGGISFAGD